MSWYLKICETFIKTFFKDKRLESVPPGDTRISICSSNKKGVAPTTLSTKNSLSYSTKCKNKQADTVKLAIADERGISTVFFVLLSTAKRGNLLTVRENLSPPK